MGMLDDSEKPIRPNFHLAWALKQERLNRIRRGAVGVIAAAVLAALITLILMGAC